MFEYEDSLELLQQRDTAQVLAVVKLQSKVQTSVLGLGVDLVFSLSQEEQQEEQEEQE